MVDTTVRFNALKNAVVEARLGQQVVVFLRGRDDQRAAINQAADLALDLAVIRVNRRGLDCFVEFASGGRLQFVASVDAGRGLSADLVYAHDSFTDEQMCDIVPCVATTGGQVLRFH